jgi:hypothetical protein
MVRKRSRPAAEAGAAPRPARPAKQPRPAPQTKQAQPAHKPPPGQPHADLTWLHRARFAAWEPSAVVALAASGDGSLLAAARDSGEIELWETDTWTCTLVRTTAAAAVSRMLLGLRAVATSAYLALCNSANYAAWERRGCLDGTTRRSRASHGCKTPVRAARGGFSPAGWMVRRSPG